MDMRAPNHVIVGTPVLRWGLVIAGVIAGLCVGGGIVAIVWNAVSPTNLKLFGATLTTGHVGVALVVVGMVGIVAVVRSAFRYLVKLAQIPEHRRVGGARKRS